jgi:hypothetical protein
LHRLPDTFCFFFGDGATTGFVTDVQTVAQLQHGFVIQVQVTGEVIDADAVVAHAGQDTQEMNWG